MDSLRTCLSTVAERGLRGCREDLGWIRFPTLRIPNLPIRTDQVNRPRGHDEPFALIQVRHFAARIDKQRESESEFIPKACVAPPSCRVHPKDDGILPLPHRSLV